MSKVKDKKRAFIIHKRQKRKAKLQHLREQYVAAQTKNDKNNILEKFKHIAPHLRAEEYFAMFTAGQKK